MDWPIRKVSEIGAEKTLLVEHGIIVVESLPHPSLTPTVAPPPIGMLASSPKNRLE
jgi:hypothetical protein